MILDDLRNVHPGSTIWVFGSGASLNFLDARFFDDKICVTANYAAKTLGIKSFYAYTNYHCDPESFGDGLITAVMLACDTLTQKPWSGDLPENVALSQANDYRPPGNVWNPYEMPPPDGQIVYGSSSIHGATHLAAHLGASHIVMVGADCGTIDGDVNVDGYIRPTERHSLVVWNRHSIILKKWLMERYGVTLYSLNPFINFNLEGHTFEGV